MSATLPDTTVTTTDRQPTVGVPLDSTRLLLAMEALRGWPEPMRFASGRDLPRFLERTGVGIPVWDAIDAALREGVPEVWLARIVGPAATPATIALAGGAGTSFTIAAHEVGEWANGAAGGLTAEVLNGPAGPTERVVIIRRVSTGAEIGRTGAYGNRADLIAAVQRIAQTIRGLEIIPMFDVTAGVDIGLPAVAGPANFAGGTADSGAITTDSVTAALERVSPDLGPMQVATPGRTTDTANEALLTYAQRFDRTALLEQAPGLAVGAITASAATLRALGSGADGLPRLGGVWSQHLTADAATVGTTRTVPATVVMAGLIARLEADEGHPNVAPFADSGVPRGRWQLAETYTDADALALFNAGVNVWTSFLGVPRNRSFRSLEADGTSEWVDLAHTRTERGVRAVARDVGRQMGSQVITRGTIAEFGSRFRARLVPLWRAGALYGDTAGQSFRVDVDTPNDAESIARREVNVDTALRMSEHAEFVNVSIAKVPIGQEV